MSCVHKSDDFSYNFSAHLKLFGLSELFLVLLWFESISNFKHSIHKYLVRSTGNLWQSQKNI